MGQQPASAIFRWFDVVALAFAILLPILGLFTSLHIAKEGQAVDFLSYWAAGNMTLSGHPELAYDAEKHRAVELSVAPIGGFLPFPYPPPFLLLVTPFGALSFWAAFPLWLAATGAFYLAATRGVASVRHALAMPPAFSVALGGQNGFVTGGLFILGTHLLERRAVLGGAVLGLLVIKPQLALMLPVALIAARNWAAIGGGVASAAGALLLALVAFGADTYAAFLTALPTQAGFLGSGQLDWTDLASLYAFGRFTGLPHAPAMALHAAVALAAAWWVWRAWAAARPERTAILAAATLLASPYLFTYDGLLLLVPMALLLRERRQPAAVALIFLFALLPVLRGFAGYPGPNTMPLAALAALWAMHRRGPGE